MDDSQGLLFFNGIDGVTGEYALPPMRVDKFFEAIRSSQAVEELHALRLYYQAAQEANLDILQGIDPSRLDQAGWGVIFAADEEHTVTEDALNVLFNHRSGQPNLSPKMDLTAIGLDSSIEKAKQIIEGSVNSSMRITAEDGGKLHDVKQQASDIGKEVQS